MGQARVPQTNVIRTAIGVDRQRLLTTLTEAFHFGKPMIVLPLFWDQYDNAQRVTSSAWASASTLRVRGRGPSTGVDRLVADDNLRARMDAVGKAVRAEDGLGRAADLIESIARGAPT